MAVLRGETQLSSSPRVSPKRGSAIGAGDAPSACSSEYKGGQIGVRSQPLPDARVLWGRALLEVKKAGKIMLHTVCVNLGQVTLVGETLRVAVPSRLDYEMLRKPQNCGDLVESLKNLGYNVNIEFVLDESARSNGGGKVARLEELLGANITVV